MLRTFIRCRLAVPLFAVCVVAGCGASAERAPASAEPPPAQALRPETPFAQALALVPNDERLHRQVLFGDLARLRAAYAGREAFRQALEGVWLPDALAGVAVPSLSQRFGFRLADVTRYVAAGFHPADVAVIDGRFRVAAIEAQFERRGYVGSSGLLQTGEDGSIDASTPEGRLALSSLNRLAVTPDRLVAASTSALARQTLAPGQTLADRIDFLAAARALGAVTSAVVVPAELVRPPASLLVAPLAKSPAVLVAAGIDDQGVGRRVVKIALVYLDPDAARADETTFSARLAESSLPGRSDTFGDVLDGLDVRVVIDRVVLITGRVPEREGATLWRSLLESGDLAIVVRQR